MVNGIYGPGYQRRGRYAERTLICIGVSLSLQLNAKLYVFKGWFHEIRLRTTVEL